MLPSRKNTVTDLHTYPTYGTHGSCYLLTLPGVEPPRPPWPNQSPHFRDPRHVAKGDVEAIVLNLENPTGVVEEMVRYPRNPCKKSLEIGSQLEDEQVEKRGAGWFLLTNVGEVMIWNPFRSHGFLEVRCFGAEAGFCRTLFASKCLPGFTVPALVEISSFRRDDVSLWPLNQPTPKHS